MWRGDSTSLVQCDSENTLKKAWDRVPSIRRVRTAKGLDNRVLKTLFAILAIKAHEEITPELGGLQRRSPLKRSHGVTGCWCGRTLLLSPRLTGYEVTTVLWNLV